VASICKDKLQILRGEFRPLWQLAWPLVLANLGWIAMGIVDTIMVGRVSAVAIGAVSLGGVIFSAAAIFGSGVLLGLDALVPQAFGSGDVDDCHRSLWNSVCLSLPLSGGLMIATWLVIPLLGALGINPAVLKLAVPYLETLIWSTLPIMLYSAFRGYLQGMNRVKPVMFALVSANLVNAACNWVLIFGHLGAPALGVVGAGWATFFSRAYMAAMLAAYILYYDHRRGTGLFRVSLRPDWVRMRELVSLGLPAALQILVEIGVFAVATALIGKLDAVSLAAHQIALNTATLTYMVPLGVGQAAAVRVGQALGKGDPPAARNSGWAAVAMGASFMACAGVVLLLMPRLIARIYTPEKAVVAAGASLLIVVAFFELFDGLQAVVMGALRGAGDTRTPMYCHLLAYWAVGLPLGAFLCFRMNWGAQGIWVGLAFALILIGSVLLMVWRRKTRVWAVSPAPVYE
jgi:MATE family, multidrug efflux pump